jgi:mevalonate kinase
MDSAGIGRAGSKVILLGEHGVVHGVDALVVGMDRGIRVEAGASDRLHVNIPAWSVNLGAGDCPISSLEADLTDALLRMFARLNLGDTPLTFNVNAVIPSRAGLGASASLGVACARAALNFFGAECAEEQLFDAVLAFENVFHHNSSGVDIRAVLRRGVGIYNRHRGYDSLEAALPALMVVHSGAPGATARTVQQFAQRLMHDKRGTEHLHRMGELVAAGEMALRERDYTALGDCMNEAQQLLTWFGVSSDGLKDICDIAIRAGAPGAKLTGGGGGGCAVALLPDEGDRARFGRLFHQAGYSVVM